MVIRRVLMFLAVLLAVAAVTSAIAPRDEQLATKPPAPGAGAAPAAAVVRADLPPPATVRARVGDVVRIRVEHDESDVVRIAALGVEAPVEPGLPAELVFDADQPGRFPITLQDATTRVGSVEIAAAAR